MMLKKNSKASASTSASKLGNGRIERQQQQKSSPRSPLKVKNLNISTSYSSSSTTTSVSSEAPRGCSGFFLSNNHSSSTNSKNRQKSLVAKTPKSAPTVKNLRGELGNRNLVNKKGNTLQNPEKPTLRAVHRLRRKPPPSSRSGISDVLSSGLSSKSGISNDLSSGFGLELCHNAANRTSVTKLGSGSDLNGFVRQDKVMKLEERDTNCSDSNSHTPPVQVSESPEIQGGSTSMVVATPTTCYGAGHVLSGVSDRRKCRAKGLLAVGNKVLFGSSKAEVCDNGDENVTSDVNSRGDSLVASPIKASMHWISSPVHERSGEGHKDQDGSGFRLNSGEMFMPLNSIGCSSSPSSSLGFSSEVFNKSNSTITTSDATTASYSGRKGGSFMDFDSNSEFRSLFGPSFEYLVCSPSPTSPTLMPSCENELRYDLAGETTPCLEDSVGSENVIRTPQSNSRSPHDFDIPHLSREEISRLWFEYEPDSEAEVLQRVSLSPERQEPIAGSPKTSFEFSPLIKPASSADFTLYQKAMGNQSPPENPESMLHSFLESEISLSWREGLSSHIFEMDELASCRCLSDDDGDTADHFHCFESHSFSETNPLDSDKIGGNREGEESFHSEAHNENLKSISHS